jgi:hypothetical protein
MIRDTDEPVLILAETNETEANRGFAAEIEDML